MTGLEKFIFFISWVIIRDRVHAHPQTQPRLIVPCPIVVHTRLFIQLFGIEEIRRVPYVVTLFYEHLTKRHILNVLRHLAIEVGDVTTAAQVVRVVEELHLLVLVIVLAVVWDVEGTYFQSSRITCLIAAIGW